MVVLVGALWALGASPGVRMFVLALVSLLIGFEAGSLKRWTLRRRGWSDLGVVVATDLEIGRAALLRYLGRRGRRRGRWCRSRRAEPACATRTDEVIGLFPEPGAPR